MTQLYILQSIATEYGESYTEATTLEESKGIDGYIAGFPISVKPVTYKMEGILIENLQGYVIFYEKKDQTVNFEVPDELVSKLSKG